MSRPARSPRWWDDLAGRPADDHRRRGAWQIGMIVVLGLLAVFLLFAVLLPGPTARWTIVVGVSVLLLWFRWGPGRRMRRQSMQPGTRSITSRWFER